MPANKSAKALLHVLQNHKTSDFMANCNQSSPEIVEFLTTTVPIDAANTLWQKNILGAPVWDEKAQRYVGFFDQRDIMSAVTAAAKLSMKQGKEHTPDEYNAIMVDNLETIHQPPSGMNGLTISYLAARNPFVSCPDDSTLLDVGQALTERKCHRVPILVNGRCVFIVSQSALVKFLYSHVQVADLEEPITSSGIDYKKKVFSVLDTVPAHEAFETLDSHRLSGIAVVDEDGSLVGNTSARDIKLAASNMGGLAMDTDILTYLAAVRQTAHFKNERYPTCHVHEKDCTVGHVIGLLAKTGYHRVFVVDEDLKPVGVISVSDVLRFAIEHGE